MSTWLTSHERSVCHWGQNSILRVTNLNATHANAKVYHAKTLVQRTDMPVKWYICLLMALPAYSALSTSSLRLSLSLQRRLVSVHRSIHHALPTDWHWGGACVYVLSVFTLCVPDRLVSPSFSSVNLTYMSLTFILVGSLCDVRSALICHTCSGYVLPDTGNCLRHRVVKISLRFVIC